jgi:hypothetical protein
LGLAQLYLAPARLGCFLQIRFCTGIELDWDFAVPTDPEPETTAIVEIGKARTIAATRT